MNMVDVRRDCMDRLNALNKELASGHVTLEKLQTQTAVIRDQVLRIEGAKIALEETVRYYDARVAAEVEEDKRDAV